MSMSIADLYSA